jgi:hypothetical protein
MTGMLIGRSLLAFCLAAFGAVPAVAADWRLMSVRPTLYGHSLSFLDAMSITGFSYFSRQTRKLNKMEVVVRADCRTLTFQFQQITAFKNQRAIGRWYSTAPAAAKPHSNVFDQIRGACGYSELGIRTYDPETVAANHFRALAKRTGSRRRFA